MQMIEQKTGQLDFEGLIVSPDTVSHFFMKYIQLGNSIVYRKCYLKYNSMANESFELTIF